MGRKSQYINIIIHPPEDQQSIDEIQEATNDLYAYIIEKKLSRCDLTPEEREYVVKTVLGSLAVHNSG